MKRTALLVGAMSAALLTSYVWAQEGGGEAAKEAAPGPAKPTAAQLANPNYHPPAKRLPQMQAFLESVKPEGNTPRMSDGHPDLSGMWNGGFPAGGGQRKLRSNGASEPDQAAVQRSTWYNKPIYKPELWDKVWNMDFSKIDVDPGYTCGALGIPRGAQKPTIFMNAQQVWIKNGEITRVVPLDGRPRNPDDSDQSNPVGYPLGHWDGDTLVVDSVGFDDRSWIGWPGFFHSDRMSLQERFTREGNVLYYQYTWTDPVVLAQPYTSVKFAFRLNPNPKAIPGPVTECRPVDTDSGILDKYYRG